MINKIFIILFLDTRALVKPLDNDEFCQLVNDAGRTNQAQVLHTISSQSAQVAPSIAKNLIQNSQQGSLNQRVSSSNSRRPTPINPPFDAASTPANVYFDNLPQVLTKVFFITLFDRFLFL